MYKADNSMHVFVSTVDPDISENLAASEVGELVILDKNGAVVPTGAAIVDGTLVQFGMKDADGNARFSPLVEFKAANVTGKAYVLRVEQTTTLDLCDDTPNTRYTLRINFKHNVELFSNQSDQYFFEYTTGNTVTAGEVLENFETQINLAGGTKDKVSAAHTAGNDGMTIVGQPQTWSLGLHADTMVLFETTITGFVAAATNVITGAVRGNGSGEQVAELEWFGVGSAGAPYRNNAMPSNNELISLQAISSNNYDVASLDCVIPGPSHAVAGSGVGRCQIIIAMATGAAGIELDEVLGFTDDTLDIFS